MFYNFFILFVLFVVIISKDHDDNFLEEMYKFKNEEEAYIFFQEKVSLDLIIGTK